MSEAPDFGDRYEHSHDRRGRCFVATKPGRARHQRRLICRQWGLHQYHTYVPTGVQLLAPGDVVRGVDLCAVEDERSAGIGQYSAATNALPRVGARWRGRVVNGPGGVVSAFIDSRRVGACGGQWWSALWLERAMSSLAARRTGAAPSEPRQASAGTWPSWASSVYWS